MHTSNEKEKKNLRWCRKIIAVLLLFVFFCPQYNEGICSSLKCTPKPGFRFFLFVKKKAANSSSCRSEVKGYWLTSNRPSIQSTLLFRFVSKQKKLAKTHVSEKQRKRDSVQPCSSTRWLPARRSRSIPFGWCFAVELTYGLLGVASG